MSMSMSSLRVSDPGSAWFGAGKYRSPAAAGGGPTRNVRLVATSVAAFVSVLGLALLLHLYICRVRRRNRRRAESAARQIAAKAPGKAGLEPSAIAALPTAAYEEEEEAGSECAICLGAMEKGDAVRVLPACAHDVFHVACVDTWLASSSSCPVCRASVEPPPPTPNPAGWVQEKPDLEKQDAAGSSTPPCGLGASLMKMLSRERPAPRRPSQVQQGDQAHAVQMDQFDLESQQPQHQQQHAVNN